MSIIHLYHNVTVTSKNTISSLFKQWTMTKGDAPVSNGSIYLCLKQNLFSIANIKDVQKLLGGEYIHDH